MARREEAIEFASIMVEGSLADTIPTGSPLARLAWYWDQLDAGAITQSECETAVRELVAQAAGSDGLPQ